MQEIADEFGVCILDPDVYPDAVKFLIAAGVPTGTADDAERMLEAARLMVAIDTPLTLRAGVNAGRVFAGPVGSSLRRSYTVIGDTVNLAARLMAHAPPEAVLAPEDLLGSVRTRFARTPLEPFNVKGKTKPIHAAIVGEPEASRHWDRAEQTPLVGRAEERRVLLDAWSATETGPGSVIELAGEAGIGKSRLVADLVSNVEDRDVRCRRRRVRGNQPLPGAPSSTLPSHRHPAGPGGGGPGTPTRGVRRGDHPQLEPWLPLLAIAFGIELSPTPATADLAPEFRRRRLAELFVEFLTAVHPDRLLVLVEDSHWLDEPSQELLAAVARACTERPWLAVFTRRPVGGGLVLPDDLAATRLSLTPLDSSAAAELAATELKDLALPAQTIEQLIARAGGNPFFLSELLAAAKAGSDLDDLPESVESLIAARIDTLAPSDRRVLRQASVLGRQFPANLLAELAGSAPLGETLERLDRFLETNRDQLRFRHALLRQTAYEGLPFRERAELHLRAAVHFEEDAAGHPDEEAEILSLHYFHGRRFDKALHYSTVAATPGAGGSRTGRSRHLLPTCPRRGARPRGRSHRRPHPARGVPGRCRGAGKPLRRRPSGAPARPAARAADAVTRARLLKKDGWIELRLGRLSQALALTARALRAVATSRDTEANALRAELRVDRAGIRQRQGRWDDSIDILRAELPELETPDSVPALARAHFLLHAALSERGDASGRAHALEAIRLFEQCGDLYGQSGVYNNLGVEAYYLGDWSEALEHYERSRELANRIGDVVEAATTMVNLGEILCDQGAFEEAEAAFSGALQVFRGAHYVFGIAYASSDLGRLRVRTGAVADAYEFLAVATEQFNAMGASVEVLETEGRRAEALLVEGHAVEAFERCTATLEALTSRGCTARGLARATAGCIAIPAGRRSRSTTPLGGEPRRRGRRGRGLRARADPGVDRPPRRDQFGRGRHAPAPARRSNDCDGPAVGKRGVCYLSLNGAT